jgi:DNA repair exonuclease SbcCD ATPase subunit
MNLADAWGFLLLEASILASLLVMVVFLRRTFKAIPPKKIKGLTQNKKSLEINLEKINQLLKESETLSQDLSNNLSEKREIIKKLMETLDEKIGSLNLLLEKVEGRASAKAPPPGGPEGNGRIMEMAMAGWGVSDIAKQLGLSQEEVQLILDLRKITAG